MGKGGFQGGGDRERERVAKQIRIGNRDIKANA